MKIKLLFRSILFLFGTFLHEFSHFAVALFLGKPEGFSIVPRREGDVFIFGAVRARVRYRVLSVFIAAAPLIWWILLLFVLRHAHAVHPGTDIQGPGISRLLEKLRSFSIHDIFSLWLAIQLLWAGRLSAQDIKTCIQGIISISGLVFILLAALLLQLFRYGR
jgi:hypothetical protein